MKILMSGGTGFIGTQVVQYFLEKKFNITLLTREKSLPLTKMNSAVRYITDLKEAEQHYDVVINLAGEPLNKKRWNDTVKKNIYESRIKTTQEIIKYIKNTPVKPQLLISGSAIGFYGSHDDRVFTEDSEPANDSFTHQLCKDWENVAMQASEYGVRVCLLRTGIVLDKQGGALKEMSPPFKFGLGAQLGSGKQWMSWIHMQDVVGAIDFLIHHNTLSGSFNLTAPNPVTNAIFSQSLAKVFNRPFFLKLPNWVVQCLFGQIANALLLNGQKVIPSKLTQAGYSFKFEHLSDALKAIYKK